MTIELKPGHVELVEELPRCSWCPNPARFDLFLPLFLQVGWERERWRYACHTHYVMHGRRWRGRRGPGRAHMLVLPSELGMTEEQILGG